MPNVHKAQLKAVRASGLGFRVSGLGCREDADPIIRKT